MAHVQREGIPALKLSGRGYEKARWRISDLPAGGALQVHVFVVTGDEVVHGRAMAEVHVLHDTEVGECLERAVDACSMNGGVPLCDGRSDLVGGEVASILGQHAEDRPAWSGHALASRVELVADLVQEGRRRDGHALTMDAS